MESGKTYQCSDGFGDQIELKEESPRNAAEEYVSRGHYQDESQPVTRWVHVRVWEEDEDGELVEDHGQYTVAVDPEEPECTHDDGHDWQRPHEVVGGIRENPGVWGHGGGVIVHDVCMRCGVGRETDTWAQDPETGEQGLTSVGYKPARNRGES